MITKKWLSKLAILLLFASGMILVLAYWQDQESSQLYRALKDQLTATSLAGTTDNGSGSQTEKTSTTASELPTTASRPDRQDAGQTTTQQTPVPTTLSPEDEMTGNILRLLKEQHEENADIIGWIRIPGTNIDYPVVLGTDNRYYLDHDINRSQSRSGSIFMDYRNNARLEQKNTILYGHHTRAHTMFTDLMNYKKQLFFKQNALIEMYTLERKTTWLIFSAYVTDTKFYFIQTNFPTVESFEPFLEAIRRRSKYFRPIDLSPQDQVLTLSTCTYEFADARFVVHAVLLDD